MSFSKTERVIDVVAGARESFAINIDNFNPPGPGSYPRYAAEENYRKSQNRRWRKGRKCRGSSLDRATRLAHLLLATENENVRDALHPSNERNELPNAIIPRSRSKSLPRTHSHPKMAATTKPTKKTKRKKSKKRDSKEVKAAISKLEKMVEKMLGFEQRLELKLQTLSGEVSTRIDHLHKGLKGNNAQISELEAALIVAKSRTESYQTSLMSSAQSTVESSRDSTAHPPQMLEVRSRPSDLEIHRYLDLQEREDGEVQADIAMLEKLTTSDSSEHEDDHSDSKDYSDEDSDEPMSGRDIQELRHHRTRQQSQAVERGVAFQAYRSTRAPTGHYILISVISLIIGVFIGRIGGIIFFENGCV